MKAGVALAATAVVLAALAFPVEVLTLASARREIVVPLADGERFDYAYTNSIYEAPVVHEQARRGDRIAQLRARSPSIRAVEYLRWDGDIRLADGVYVQEAPAIEVAELVLRITAGGAQRLSSTRWSIDFRGSFGESAVKVRPERRPLVALLAASLAR